MEKLVEQIGVKAERWLARRGFGGEADDSSADDGSDDDDAHGKLLQASLGHTLATEGKAVRRVQVLGVAESATDGWSYYESADQSEAEILFAATVIPAAGAAFTVEYDFRAMLLEPDTAVSP